MNCPSPFDFKAYAAHQHALHGDPWRQMKINAKASEGATRVREEKLKSTQDLMDALAPKTFHVYAKARSSECKN